MSSLLNTITKFNLKGIHFSRLEPSFNEISEVGLYLHIPFCKILCPFCPYYKEIFRKDKAKRYIQAVKKEIAIYSELIPDATINSFYIGGGTPSLIIEDLLDVIGYAQDKFNINCDFCIEANPEDLDGDKLERVLDLGVKKLSIGIQSFDDQVLRNIGRLSYSGKQAFDAVRLAGEKGFSNLNVDLMFLLPSQKIKTDLSKCIEAGANQITTYPLLLFPYTKLAREVKEGKLKMEERKEKEIYREIIGFFSKTSYKQVAAWSFAKEGIERYGSVERENYLGLGASAISSFDCLTYANTFSIAEYIKTVGGGKLPIAFGSPFNKKQAMIQWFMLRLYGLRVSKKEFKDRFDLDLEEALAPILRALKLFRILENKGSELIVKKPYLIHQLTKTFLLTYISKISEEGLKNPWPKEFRI